MTKILFWFTAVCDYEGKGRCCTDNFRISGNPLVETMAEFRQRAVEELKVFSWHIGKQTLCPMHNTHSNRKKRFRKDIPGSLAALARTHRLGGA